MLGVDRPYTCTRCSFPFFDNYPGVLIDYSTREGRFLCSNCHSSFGRFPPAPSALSPSEPNIQESLRSIYKALQLLEVDLLQLSSLDRTLATPKTPPDSPSTATPAPSSASSSSTTSDWPATRCRQQGCGFQGRHGTCPVCFLTNPTPRPATSPTSLAASPPPTPSPPPPTPAAPKPTSSLICTHCCHSIPLSQFFVSVLQQLQPSGNESVERRSSWQTALEIMVVASRGLSALPPPSTTSPPTTPPSSPATPT